MLSENAMNRALELTCTLREGVGLLLLYHLFTYPVDVAAQ
jgi:hypothetical protein